MVRDVADMMRLRAEEKGLRLLLDQSSGFPRYIKGDEASCARSCSIWPAMR